MNICIFPGTFNPIHNAHLQMAEYVLNNYNFDKVIFIPSYIPPHKELDKNLAVHRMNMVKLAVQDNPQLMISDIEYKNENKSYSIYTVKQIIKKYNVNGRLSFIIGKDAFEKIESWYNAEELKHLVHFIVFPRGINDNEVVYKDLSAKGWNFEIVNTDILDISSTQLRNDIQNKFINEKVKDYIEKNELYKL